jgi:two-component system cell cycle response regulator CpdR
MDMARILLAEDDESLRLFLARALGRAGHAVTDCGDGIVALQHLQARDAAYDLLLADIVMPGMDGIELARRGAESLPSLRVLFITGFAAVALHARRAGPATNTMVLSKPFHLRDLVEQVDRILAA